MLNGEELIRLIDTIHRDKDIDKEVLFEAIEAALLTAVRKRYGEREDLAIEIERETGEIIAWQGEVEAADVDLNELGRIAAQTAKQVIIQKIRDAERDVIFDDYEHKVNTIVSGLVQRIEGGNIIVNLGKAEGIIPRHEKVRSENYNPGDRIKAIIYDVKKVGPKVKIMLSRADPAIVKMLFELEVPEIAERVIEIRSIAREPGFRTKIAVHSIDSRVDCIGACVGIRGTRIKSITDELNGEKIDIIRWSDSPQELILNALRPAQISNITIDEPTKVARVQVPDDQLSLAIGRKGQNVRLAAKLTGYDLKIFSPSQAALGEREGEKPDAAVEAVRDVLLQDAPAAGSQTSAPPGETAPGAAEPAAPLAEPAAVAAVEERPQDAAAAAADVCAAPSEAEAPAEAAKPAAGAAAEAIEGKEEGA
ncbi:MAG: transcription termination/antitermination protein NusA [Planctomycetes bacterium]|nr:transcription termination/antitermination protein NusA [Planctomycetota bacterium]